MSKQEILITPIGEMMDMLACFSIFEGAAKPKKPKMNFNDFIHLK